MSTTEIIVLVVVLLLVAAVVAALMAQARKRKRLQSKFGPEYDRTVESSNRRRDAERELAEREQRRQSLDIRPLPAADRKQFSERWSSTQADFVDHPEVAVRQADLLVTEVMGRRGYPVGDFDQMSRDVSVDHAEVVHEYRAAHEISELNDRKQATTEQLRQAMVHYRALFTDLLSDDDDRGTTGDRHLTDDRHAAGSGYSTRDDRDRDSGLRGSDDVRDRDTSYVSEHDSRYESDRHDAGRHDAPLLDRDRDRDRDLDRDRDRDSSQGMTSDRVATSRSEGVRVEPGGIDRPRTDDRDRPRG